MDRGCDEILYTFRGPDVSRRGVPSAGQIEYVSPRGGSCFRRLYNGQRVAISREFGRESRAGWHYRG